MSLKDVNIPKIEQYLRGDLSPSAVKEFEQKLAEDVSLKEEVAHYRELLGGLDALSTNRFLDQMRQWEDDIELSEEEIIEQYWEGTLPANTHKEIEFRIAEDPGFKERADQQKQILEGFNALQSEQFRNKIREWEKQKSVKVRKLSWRNQLAVAASFLVLIGFGLWWYASSNFGDQALVASYYRVPATATNTMGDPDSEKDRLTSAFNRAHQLLIEEKYQEAVLAFDTVRNQAVTAEVDDFTRDYLLDNATFNRALALIGAGAEDNQISEALAEVLNDPASDYRRDASRLQSQLNSFWRKIGN